MKKYYFLKIAASLAIVAASAPTSMAQGAAGFEHSATTTTIPVKGITESTTEVSTSRVLKLKLSKPGSTTPSSGFSRPDTPTTNIPRSLYM